MKPFLKMLSSAISAGFFTLLLLPFPFIQGHAERDRNHTYNKNKLHQVSPKLLFEIKLHGVLLWASLGFLMPLGILVIRMSRREEHGRRVKIMFYTHVVLEILAVLLATAGAAMSLKHFDNSFSNTHQRLGLALYIIVWLQTLIGILRPHRGSKARRVWFFAHWLLGTALSLLGVINIYTGLQAYNKRTSRSTNIWTIIFSTQISLVVFFYLFQEKWYYIKNKAGAILGSNEAVQPTTDQETFPVVADNEKKADVLPQP
ncbi:PREDICTED: cytochrome b561 domain-containing protein At4g18260-like isoform X2 [Ipomoea nil]|uniref:cytochrome b561 domain-containing protein At4g18260-like isoform X2 n=1 Tax=Ipomoea nil TaxID=35883 RepID=UPI0009018CB7|nr:PREDICTED: cytochrome b561 domain-containing protein At4g18260-like isoform X2 [Ipomoea nil]